MTLTRKTELKRTGIIKRTSFLRASQRERRDVPKLKQLKSRGMKGRAPTAEEQRFMSAIASLGCLVCAKDGITNPWISLHHIEGRTKPDAHMLVLPLCANHHQHDDLDPAGRVGVHPFKARFEAKYGTQMELLAEAIAQVRHQLRNPDGSYIRLPDALAELVVAQIEREAA